LDNTRVLKPSRLNSMFSTFQVTTRKMAFDLKGRDSAAKNPALLFEGTKAPWNAIRKHT
jgi:hypothetical protein